MALMLFLSVSWLCSCFLGQADRCIILACSQNQGKLLYFPLLCLVLLSFVELSVFKGVSPELYLQKDH